MKALTLWQPWASLIIWGPKRIENRTWAPPQFVLFKRIAIHAGKKLEKHILEELGHRILPGGLPVPAGAILGTAFVQGSVTKSDDEFFAGPIGWVLSDIERFKVPVPCPGAQGLWDVPIDIVCKFPTVTSCIRG